MVLAQINLSCLWGSTGKICDAVSKLLTEKGVENYIFYTYGDNPEQKPNYIKYGSPVYEKIQALKSRVIGNYGFNSRLATKDLIKKLDKVKPDIVHVHNIHGHDCDFEMLFEYLKKNKIKVFYTFHDCWAFTGYCPHFVIAKCDNWKTGCGNCVSRKKYSWFFDCSRKNHMRKSKALDGVDLTVITPSRWLSDLVKQSFLKDRPVKVINNGIDLETFRYTEGNFREKNNLTDKKIILGVSFVWDYSKGLDVFIELSKKLPDDYKVVIVGTNEKIDKLLPSNILSIHRTHNQKELAEIYSSADVFVNPTREENFPTVNMEAIACGTPVVTFRTGGSPEMLDDTCGFVVECDDTEGMLKEIVRVCTEKPYTREACIEKSKEFERNDRFKEYVSLYERIDTSGA